MKALKRIAGWLLMSDNIEVLIGVAAGVVAGSVIYNRVAGLFMGLVLLEFLAMAGFFIGLLCMCLGRGQRLSAGVMAVTATVIPTAVRLTFYPLRETVAGLAVFFAITWLLPVGVLWLIKRGAN